MQDIQSKGLTETALVAELQGRGYSEISIRTIEEWRRRELLPDFDQKGPGLGRGAGRLPSLWINSEEVIAQAAWVSDLIRVYGRMESAYLPLWMLGYAVPLKRVKNALKQPVADLSRSIRKEMQRTDELTFEDVIDDAMYEAGRTFQKHGPLGLQMSLDKLSAAYNLLFNPEYIPEDGAFEDFLSGDAVGEDRELAPKEDQIALLFRHAPFIKEHLSLAPINEALRHCTTEDLKAVERDLCTLREIVFHAGRLMKAMFSAVPAEYTDGFRDKWHPLFTVGRMCILVDLSLRRSGFGDWIDAILPDVLHHVLAECTESKEAELRANSTQLFAAIQASTEELARTWKASATPKLERSLS